MLTTFLIVLGILALFGAGNAEDACAITLLLKIVPFLIIVVIAALFMFFVEEKPKKGLFLIHCTAILLNFIYFLVKKEYFMRTTMNTISARIDSKLKTQAENLFNELGMNMSTAITVFLKQSVRLRRIPFEISLDTPNAETLAAMAEANEIASGKRKAKSYKNAKAMIKDILDE